MEQAFQEAIQEHGAMKMNVAHYMPFGPPNVGKTCLLRRLVDKDPLGVRATIKGPCGDLHSTDALTKPVQVMIQTRSNYEPTAVLGDNTKWREVESVDEERQVVIILANQSSALRSNSQTKPLPLTNATELVSPSQEKIKPPSKSKVEELQDEHSTPPQVNTVNQTSTSKDDTDNTINPHVNKSNKKAINPKKTTDPHFAKFKLTRKSITIIRDMHELLDNNSMTLYCTDTGGQPEFQEVLPALIAGPSIFLFVFNLLKGLDSRYNVTYSTPEKESEVYISSFTVKQVLLQFLSSIASYHNAVSHLFQHKIPPPSVIAIGTHRDLISQAEFLKLDKKLKEVCGTALPLLTETESINIEQFNQNQLIIPINNYSEVNDSVSVRKIVEEVVRRDCKIDVPVAWLMLQLHLRDLPNSAVSYATCAEIAKECNISEDELPQCLKFLHYRTGTVRYYDFDELKDIVIIKPSIVFHAVTELIIHTFTLKKVQRIERDRFQKLGLFKASTLEYIFNNHNLQSEIPLKAFLALLEHLYILGPSHDDALGDYFLPCALVHAPEPDSSVNSLDPLCLVFGCRFVPKGFYSSLLAFLCQKK